MSGEQQLRRDLDGRLALVFEGREVSLVLIVSHFLPGAVISCREMHKRHEDDEDDEDDTCSPPQTLSARLGDLRKRCVCVKPCDVYDAAQ